MQITFAQAWFESVLSKKYLRFTLESKNNCVLVSQILLQMNNEPVYGGIF